MIIFPNILSSEGFGSDVSWYLLVAVFLDVVVVWFISKAWYYHGKQREYDMIKDSKKGIACWWVIA
jgi:hypothetical protein